MARMGIGFLAIMSVVVALFLVQPGEVSEKVTRVIDEVKEQRSPEEPGGGVYPAAPKKPEEQIAESLSPNMLAPVTPLQPPAVDNSPPQGVETDEPRDLTAAQILRDPVVPAKRHVPAVKPKARPRERTMEEVFAVKRRTHALYNEIAQLIGN